YFTRHNGITLLDFQLYGANLKHHGFETPADRTTDLRNKAAFTLTSAPDAPGPLQVLTRTAGSEVFLLVRFSLV
ncbi:MAG TPA: hypothetical protein VMC06_07075, partial [Opitutaceae bacterium]|nr:hypothetical protein [Opitutaceae bacterium]